MDDPVIFMDMISWIYVEKIFEERPQRANCPIEDLSVQKCEFLESRLPESLQQFFTRKREVMKRLEKNSATMLNRK